MFRRLATMLAVMVLSVGMFGPKAAAAGSLQFNPPKQYYLALGDSVAFGFQLGKFDALAQAGSVDPAAFNTGYVNDLSAMLQAIQPGIQTVNYGCPGLTSAQFVAPDGCPTYPFPLHNGYTGSQLGAAVAFLHDHPGQVSPITLDVGANDVDNVLRGCLTDPTTQQSCIAESLPGVLQQVDQNLYQIISALRQAAPNAEIIVMQYYNPFAISPALAVPSTQAAEALNAEIAGATLSNRARVADAYTPFNLSTYGAQYLCVLTGMCTTLQDIHPSDAGYMVIAQQFWSASNYARLSP